MSLRIVSMVLLLSFGATPCYSAELLPAKSDDVVTYSSKSISEFKAATLKNIRLMQEKQSLQMEVEEINSQRRARAASSTATADAVDATGLLLSSAEAVATFEQAALMLAAASIPDGDLIYGELIRNQQASPFGLVVSYTQQIGLENQGFTYDQALAGIAMLNQGDTASAAKIVDFYKSQWDGTGLSTVYNTQVWNGWAIEDDKILGPNAWVALLAVQYYKQTGDAGALDLAVAIGKWVTSSIPQTSGGRAMGEWGTQWAELYSVENNLSYYAVLSLLAVEAPTDDDRYVFARERDRLKEWLKHPGYDADSTLFRRGAYLDTLKALDTNTWGILALGVSGLQDIGVDVPALVASIEREFLVNYAEGYGSYGGDVFAAKGFDFSYSTNAFLTWGRPAVKWVEGTNQMITVYRVLADYYANGPAPDAALAADYAAKADYFSALNLSDQITTAGGVSYSYSDTDDTQVFFDVPSWRTAAGPSVAAAAWVYFSLYGLNPLA